MDPNDPTDSPEFDGDFNMDVAMTIFASVMLAVHTVMLIVMLAVMKPWKICFETGLYFRAVPRSNERDTRV